MSNAPRVGQVVFGDQDCTQARVVLHVDGTSILTVPFGVDIRSCHKGNVYNERGEREWQD